MSNVISFIGTIGNDAEIRYLPSGQAVLNVNVANHTGFGDKQKTMWFRVVLWGKRAEGSLKDYLKKGQQVFVSGEFTTNEYKANDGTMKMSLELNANIIDLVGKRESIGNANDYNTPAQASSYTPQAYQQPAPAAQPAQNYAPPPQPKPNYAPQQQAPRPAPSPNFDAPYDDDIPF